MVKQLSVFDHFVGYGLKGLISLRDSHKWSIEGTLPYFIPCTLSKCQKSYQPIDSATFLHPNINLSDLLFPNLTKIASIHKWVWGTLHTFKTSLTRRPLSYRNQFIDLLWKSIDWFLYDNGLSHDKVKLLLNQILIHALKSEYDFELFRDCAQIFLLLTLSEFR